MKIKYHISILFIIISMSQISFAQKVLSLEECINYALSNNIDIKMNELQLEIKESNLLQSKASMLPSLNANGNDIINWGKTVDRYTNQFADSRTVSVNLYLQSSITVFHGFRLLNTVKLNQLELEATKYDLDYFKDMKALEITTAFLQILYDKENLINKREQLKLTQQQVERSEKLVEAGSAAKGDLYNIKSQYASEKALMVDAENKLNLSFLKLKQLMYLPGDTIIDIYAPEISLTKNIEQLNNPYTVYNYALDNRPEIKSAEIRVESSQKNISIAKGNASPQIRISAGLGSGYSGANSILNGQPNYLGHYPNGDITSAGDTVLSPSFNYDTKPKPWDDQLIDNKNYSIGFYLTVPIFNGLQTYTAISQSKIAYEQAELQLEKSKNNMLQSIEQAYADARSALNQYEAAKIKLEALKEAFTYAEQRYSNKMVTALEYNDAKIKLSMAQSDVLNAKYNYIFRTKVLDFYYGKPLKL